MFKASSSSTATIDLKRSYAAAVDGVVAGTGGNRRTMGRVAVVVGAAAAVGASVLIGGGLLYSAAHRTDKSSSDQMRTVAPETSADNVLSWWQRALAHLPLRLSAEDDNDAFASGTGAANLFDNEKIKARQLSKDKSKAGATRAGAAATAFAAPRKPEKAGSPPDTKLGTVTAIAYPEDVQERERYVKLLRVLLRRLAGIEYSDDDSSSSSDSTDVSLNYHFASAMEATARDDLLMAFAAYEDYNEGLVSGGVPTDETTDEEGKELLVNTLVKTLEYVDLSNEREKLRYRRLALYREQGRTTPASLIDAAEDDEDDAEDDMDDVDDADPINAMYRRLAARYGPQQHLYREFGDDEEVEGEGEGNGNANRDYDFPSAASRQARQFQAMFGPSMMGMDPQTEGKGVGDSVLDRILGQASASAGMGGHADSTWPNSRYSKGAAAHGLHDGDNDWMEEEWEDEDDPEEADFMAYLQQPDDAAHFYSRHEMQQARRDPGNDVRVVGTHDSVFGMHDDDAENEDDWEDDEDDEDDEGRMARSKPWSRQEKADFERELFGRIYQLANKYTLTAAMAERETDEEDTRKAVERQQRRQQKQQLKLPAATPASTSGAGKARPPSVPVAEDDEEWADEGEWEDEDEEA